MSDQYLKFQQFTTEEQFLDYTDFLTKENIRFETEDNTPLLDPNVTFNPSQFQKSFLIKLLPEDFPKVKRLLADRADKLLDEIEEDHYLFSFTDMELIEVLKKPDEWNLLDVQLAKRILTDRSLEIPEDIVQKMEEQRIEELRKPKSLSTTELTFGYFIALLGGILGIFFSWLVIKAKETLPDGTRVATFDRKTKQHAQQILGVSIVVFMLVVGVYIWG